MAPMFPIIHAFGPLQSGKIEHFDSLHFHKLNYDEKCY